MTNKEFLEYIRQRVAREKRKDLKRKLKENYYDNRLNGGRKNENK